MKPMQYRKDQKGGGQATGRNAPTIPDRFATGLIQTDNGTGAGTKTTKLKRVPGV